MAPIEVDKRKSQSGQSEDKSSKRPRIRAILLNRPAPVGFIGTALVIMTLLMVGAADLFKWLQVLFSGH